MIAFVRGIVAAVQVDSAVVEVGGVGLHVMCTPSALASLHTGAEARLATSMVVREESLTLYGFADDDERAVFELLQTASGVGPKLAQAMLAVHSPDELRRMVQAEDISALCTVPGIGRKGAQRIVLELKDRIGDPGRAPGATGPGVAAATAPGSGVDSGWREQVRSGLLGLGWPTKDAEAAVDTVAPMAEQSAAEGNEVAVAELLRAALRSLSKT